MKLNKIVTQVVSIIVFATALLALAVSCVSPAGKVNYLKKQIPEAKQFLEDHEESLHIVLSVQNRIDDVMYMLFTDDELRVFDFSEGKWGDRLLTASVHECDFLSDEEKWAFMDLLSSPEAQSFQSFFIIVRPVETRINLMSYSDGLSRDYADMIVRNGMPSDLPNSSRFYQEQVDDIWYIEISHTPGV